MSLTSLLLTPFIGTLLVLLVPGNYRVIVRLIALVTTAITAIAAILLFAAFKPGVAEFQFEHQAAWIPAAGLSYHVGVDGLNIGLVLMAALVAFAATCVSWDVERNPKLFYLLLLMMTGGAIGAFVSLDLFFLYFFNELALVPTFIMMGLWGRGEQKNFATFQITLYLTLGALVALTGLVALYALSGANTLDIVTLKAWLAEKPLTGQAQALIFPLLLFGFGTLVGLWPFHSWAAPGYAAAPTATAMMHSGVLKKVGLYALIRVALPLLPDGLAHWTPVIAWLCLGNILYCGWVAMSQRDLALLLGNSSLAHMGFCFLGLASVSVIGVTGVVVIMVAHGLLAAVSFGLLGHLVKVTGTSDMDKLGGLLRPLPFIGAALVAALMAGCGLPGFANFPGEITVMFGAWKSLPGFVVVAAWGGLLIGGVYMLRAIRTVLHGPVKAEFAKTEDANCWRKLPFLVLLGALIYFGVNPGSLVERIKPAVTEVVKAASAKSPAAQPAASAPTATAMNTAH
jgi:NADH-quinone oxidoreductase subunit M